MYLNELDIGTKAFIDGVVPCKVAARLKDDSRHTLTGCVIVQLDFKHGVRGHYGDDPNGKPTFVSLQLVHCENLYPEQDESKDVYR